MTTLNISLPDNLRGWIDARVKKGDYSSASDYMRDLIRNDRRSNAELDELLLEGINSGDPIVVNSSFWEKKRQQLKMRIDK